MKKALLGFTLFVLMLLFALTGYSQVDVLTQHNDLGRTGWNNKETILNTSNVNTNSFGLLYKRTVDDQIYAQPLVVSGVSIPSKGAKNVVYVCTVNNTVYAFDADDSTAAAYWQVNFTPTGYRPPNRLDIHPGLCGGGYYDFSNQFGLVGTPVIDKSSNTMYFVTKIVNNDPTVIDNHTWDGNELAYTNTGFFQYLHAVDLSTGAEKFGGPTKINPSVTAAGDGSVSGVVTFDPRRQFNRSGLVLSKGIVYVAFAAHCDWDPYHGWLVGYDASSLQQKIAYISTPNDGRGGIWMSGSAPAVDQAGNLYVTTGNGYNDGHHYTVSPTVSVNRGESVIRLTPNASDNTASALNVTGYFTPYNYQQYDDADLDFPIQTMLIPNTKMLMTGCKDNLLYLMDTANLGGFNTSSNNVLQTVSVGSNAQMHSSFAYFGGASNQYVYQFSENTLLQSFKVNPTSLATAVTGSVSGPTGGSGAFMSVSSNGTDASSAILWITHAKNGCNSNQQTCPGILRAVRADDVTKELWNSNMISVDNLGVFSKMNCPTVVNGKVYATTFSNQMPVYGLRPISSVGCSNNVALFKTATASSVQSGTGFVAGDAFDADLTTRWSSQFTANEWLEVDLGAKYDICQIVINWENALGANFTIDVSNDNTTWTTAQSFTGNTDFQNTVTGNFQGRYVRMKGTKRGSPYGYSIYEMQVYGQLSNPCGSPANLNATNITENSATLNWDAVSGATSYIIQYKTSLVSSWVSKTSTTATINLSALSCATGYTYQIQAVCASGKSAVVSGTFTTSTCSATCGPLHTRYFNADIGDIGVAGSSCLNNEVYTIKGSGNGFGGNVDQFQYAFANLAGDERVLVQVATQDATNASNKAGLMFRDSVSDTSPFAFIGLTSTNGIVFHYRSVPNGSTSTVTVPGIAAPYWVQLVKAGTKYSAYISGTGAGNSWMQVGSTVDLGFGNSPTFVGMAVSSANNTMLSTATFANYAELTTPLPLNLLSFDGININDQYIMLKWEAASGSNSKYFTVQKSDDGVKFTDLGKVAADSDTNINQYYSINDNQPFAGANYYRLEQTDFDGTISYSAAIKVNFGTWVNPKLSPNPFHDHFTIEKGIDPIKEITVFDITGRTLTHIVNTDALSEITVTTGNLAAGVYLIKITTSAGVYQQKMIKQH